MQVMFKGGSIEVYEAQATLADGMTSWILVDRAGRQVASVNGVKFEWRDCVRGAPEGLLMEFGVRGGGTMREIATEAGKYGRVVYGFDWWRGLPHEWDEYSPKGSCLAQKPTDLPDNVILVEGLFSDTLEAFLADNHDPVGFINLDCDLYAPSIFVLHCLMGRFVKGSLIAFSAMTNFPTLAQKAAWDQYLQESGQRWEFLGKQHVWGEVYRCLST